MHRIFELAKILRKCSSGFNFFKKNEEKSDSAYGSYASLFAPIVAVAIVVGLFFLTNHFADLITMFGGAAVFLPALFAIIGFACIALTFIELVNTMYMSSDFAALITLPFSSSEIAGARILNASPSKYLIAALIAIPSVLGYGFATSPDIGYYLTSLLLVILVPLFAILATAILVIFIMTFVRVFRNRDVFAIVGILIALAAFVAYMIFVNTNTSLSDFGNAALASMGTISGFANFIPVVPLLVGFYTTGNVLLLIAALGLVLVAIILLTIFVRVFYLRGAMSIHSGSKRKVALSDLKKSTKKHSATAALTKKELRTVFRTPAYFIYGWIVTLVWPVFLIVPFILKTDLSEVVAQATSAEGLPPEALLYAVAIACFIAFAAALIVTSLSNFAYGAISRDGPSFFFNKIIPVSFRDQLRAKRNAALIVSLIGVTLYALIITLVVVFTVKLLPLWAIVPILIISLATILFVNNLQIYFGVRQANLDWTDESAVGKKISPVLALGAFVVSFGGMIGFLFSLMFVPAIVWVCIFIIISVVAAVISERLSLSAAARLMADL